jgi:hypothetical protein
MCAAAIRGALAKVKGTEDRCCARARALGGGQDGADGGGEATGDGDHAVLGEDAEIPSKGPGGASAVATDVHEIEVLDLGARFIWQVVSVIFWQGVRHRFCPHSVCNALKLVSISAEIHCRYSYAQISVQ